MTELLPSARVSRLLSRHAGLSQAAEIFASDNFSYFGTLERRGSSRWTMHGDAGLRIEREKKKKKRQKNGQAEKRFSSVPRRFSRSRRYDRYFGNCRDCQRERFSAICYSSFLHARDRDPRIAARMLLADDAGCLRRLATRSARPRLRVYVSAASVSAGSARCLTRLSLHVEMILRRRVETTWTCKATATGIALTSTRASSHVPTLITRARARNPLHSRPIHLSLDG